MFTLRLLEALGIMRKHGHTRLAHSLFFSMRVPCRSTYVLTEVARALPLSFAQHTRIAYVATMVEACLAASCGSGGKFPVDPGNDWVVVRAGCVAVKTAIASVPCTSRAVILQLLVSPSTGPVATACWHPQVVALLERCLPRGVAWAERLIGRPPHPPLPSSAIRLPRRMVVTVRPLRVHQCCKLSFAR